MIEGGVEADALGPINATKLKSFRTISHSLPITQKPLNTNLQVKPIARNLTAALITRSKLLTEHRLKISGPFRSQDQSDLSVPELPV
jgi:hypothetical protein